MTKLFFDQNLSFKLCDLLADLFPGSDQARLAGLDRASDAELWDHAGANGFVLVSQDVDFAEMAALKGAPPKVILLRSGNRPTKLMGETLRRNAAVIEGFVADKEARCLELI